jgi:hypothetical protein
MKAKVKMSMDELRRLQDKIKRELSMCFVATS